MQTSDIVVETDVTDSFRVKQLEGMFDLPVTKTIEHRITIDPAFEEIHDKEFKWNVGLILGPSGSGKSVMLSTVFNKHLRSWAFKWNGKAVVDNVGQEKPIQEVTDVFCSVGFSSPPSWLKPFRVLSNGEKFRVELARCILDGPKTFAFDEFTSLVDRDVAKATSYAVSKALRKYGKRMVAASCHYDILQWLQPDWYYDLRDGTFTRRRLRRPRINLSVFEVHRNAWKVFKPHHYLSGDLHRAAKCFGVFWKDILVGFCAMLQKTGFKNCYRVHRLVVLPDYQGLGIGLALLRQVACEYKGRGHRVTITSAHPAIIHGLKKKPYWRPTKFYGTGTRPPGARTKQTGRAGTGCRAGSVMATYEFGE